MLLWLQRQGATSSKKHGQRANVGVQTEVDAGSYQQQGWQEWQEKYDSAVTQLEQSTASEHVARRERDHISHTSV